jgi:hypothetical protein
MGLFDIFRKLGGRYVSENGFQKNLAKQTAMSPQTLKELREFEVTDETRLELEFFFYTNTQKKAVALSEALKKLRYSIEVGPSPDNKREYLITGWTKKMEMSENTLTEWTRRMCRLGFDLDCEFDGWATSPEQE